MSIVLETINLSRILQEGDLKVTLVDNINLQLASGEFTAITGPSGSGKSSLLYLLGLLDSPTQGDLLINGQSTTQLSEEERAWIRLNSFGFVFQFHFLLAELTVLENVMVPMRQLGKLTRQVMGKRALELLAAVGIADQSYKRPAQLSGGQRQRVAIARALANDPQFIFADEPTGALDTKNANAVFDLLAGLARDQGKTVAVVTHDENLASKTWRRLRMEDGRLVDNTNFERRLG
ncbi:MAG TPA: ABC transporter ATP-binding protein [Alphaproteobacteria bacterium]|jgi:lipoprotein-releasing system ATP-binding protein|nr:ABC transporter ATP-binding protein [Alphaproteobacteria bacterium]